MSGSWSVSCAIVPGARFGICSIYRMMTPVSLASRRGSSGAVGGTLSAWRFWLATISHPVLKPRLNKICKLLSFIKEHESFVRLNYEVCQGCGGLGVHGLVFAEMRLCRHDWAGCCFGLGTEDFAGVDVEPPADPPERFEVGKVAALHSRECCRARSDLFGDLPHAPISPLFKEFQSERLERQPRHTAPRCFSSNTKIVN